MLAPFAPLLHALAVLLGELGVHGPGTVLATLAASAAIVALATAIVALARAARAALPRVIAVGARSRRHAILLGHLPDSVHPDARGHIRSRAPGLAASAA